MWEYGNASFEAVCLVRLNIIRTVDCWSLILLKFIVWFEMHKMTDKYSKETFNHRIQFQP